MLIFQKLSVQVSPKPLIFLENAEKGSRFCDALGLRDDAEVYCHVASINDGSHPLSSYDTELDSDYSGIATVSRTYSESDIWLYLTERQFDFFFKAVLSLADQHRTVRLTVVPRTEFKIANRVRVHLIDKNPMISFAEMDAE